MILYAMRYESERIADSLISLIVAFKSQKI